MIFFSGYQLLNIESARKVQKSKRNETYWCPEKYAYEDQKKKSWKKVGFN